MVLMEELDCLKIKIIKGTSFQGLEFRKSKEIFDNARDLDVCVLVFTLDCCYIFMLMKMKFKERLLKKLNLK